MEEDILLINSQLILSGERKKKKKQKKDKFQIQIFFS